MLTLPRRDDELVGVQLGALHQRHRVDEDGAEDRLQRARAVEALERVVEGARQGAREAVGVALDGLARLQLLLHAEIAAGQRGGDRQVGIGVGAGQAVLDARSEEHTSELQSLMRISYAVFCLKKKNKSNNTL